MAEDFREAREQGHCDRLVDLVAETSWSDGGSLTRDEFLEICPGVVDGYEPMEVDEPELVEQSLRVDGDTAEVDVDGYEPARLVREGGRALEGRARWRAPSGPDAPPGVLPVPASAGATHGFVVRSELTAGEGGTSSDYVEAVYLVAVQDTTVVAVWYDLGGSPPPPAAEPDAVEQATAILTAQLDRL